MEFNDYHQVISVYGESNIVNKSFETKTNNISKVDIKLYKSIQMKKT